MCFHIRYKNKNFKDIFIYLKVKMLVTLHDPMDCSPPGSSVPGILKARIMESVAGPSFRDSS